VFHFLNDLLTRNFKDVDKDVIKFFVKTRIGIRIKYLNLLQEEKKFKRQEQKRLAAKRRAAADLDEILDEGYDIEDEDRAEADLDLIDAFISNLPGNV